MLDFRPILLVIGLLLATLGVAMLIPALADLVVGHEDWQVFMVSSATTFFIGISLFLINRGSGQDLNLRQAFMLTTLTWAVIALFGALPLYFSELELSFTDAFFESMSGITTTGSTVMTGLDEAPPGILLWRAILQWLGGIGIIVMAVAVLPMLQVGGMQLFRMESSDTSEKILPRARQIAGALTVLYLAISGAAMLCMMLAGMPAFDAVAHAMTTVSTAGYSTHDASIGHYDSALLDAVVTLFMILGALPFVLYLQVLRGRPMALWRDTQVQWFFGLLLAAFALLCLYRIVIDGEAIGLTLRHVSFNLVSILTGTGYTTTGYDAWGEFSVGVFFLIMFIGGCAGSTSCGFKIFRVQILYENARRQVLRLIQPHGVFIPYYNHKPIPASVNSAVMTFFFVFFICFIVLSVLLSAFGLDFITAASGAGSALANVGPGLGPVIGPTGNFQSLPDGAKWLLSAAMLLGRLELLSVLVLFSPGFWRS